MKCLRSYFVQFLLSCLFFSFLGVAASADTFQCSNPEPPDPPCGAPPLPPIDTTGRLKAVVIYATWDSTTHPKKDTLPDWWARIWDTTRQLSVPKFYKDNSRGKYSLQTVPKGLNSVRCFTSPYQPVGLNGGESFTIDILQRADDSINFADFDSDGDNIVDALFLVIVNAGGSRGSVLALTEFLTDDYSATGQIKIRGGFPGNAVGQFVLSEELAISICSHEWGHALGLGDFYGGISGGPGNCWALGSFSIMGTAFWNARAVPFDPYNRIALGWDTALVVNTPLYGRSIPNSFTTGTIYKLPVPADSLIVFTNQYFLITNHKGVDPELDSIGRWEEFFPTSGLLIWHTGGQGGFCPPGSLVDLELPHGMYRYDASCNRTISDSSTTAGKDSLGIGKCQVNGPDSCITWCGYHPGFVVGSATCFWPFGAKKNFDGKSNPSSDAWNYETDTSAFALQNFPSHMAVRNIQSTPLGPATADLLVNNWYGHITQNTTWGPNKIYAITGDIIIDSGKTLTIDSCTNIHFQANEDNQKSLPDTTRSAIVVQPGGKLIIKGTKAFPVQFFSSKPESLATNHDWQGIVIRPGGVLACSNAVIRHAYAAIEDSSVFSHTIKNVRIGRCKMYGINAVTADSLTIQGCRIDSVKAVGSTGGYGIYIELGKVRLVKDTLKACFYGIQVSASSARIDTCLVEAGSGAYSSYAGLRNFNQGALDTSTLPVAYTTFCSNSAAFTSGQIVENNVLGRLTMFACTLISSVSSPTAHAIRNSVPNAFLKLRSNTILDWNTTGVVLENNGGLTNADLGRNITGEFGNNAIYTSATNSTWKFVRDDDCGSCTSPIFYAEKNCWGSEISSSRFSPNVDYSPFSNFCLFDPPSKVAAGEENLPRTALFQNYPNPFNPSTQIQFTLEKTEKVRLEIFNILGQKVRTMLGGEEFSAGPYTFIWNGRDDGNVPVSSGTYIYKLATPSFGATKKMQLVK